MASTTCSTPGGARTCYGPSGSRREGGKTARVSLSAILIEALEQVPLDKRSGYLLPTRSRITVYKRLEIACRTAKVEFKGCAPYSTPPEPDFMTKPAT